jgi:hypothetical protein
MCFPLFWILTFLFIDYSLLYRGEIIMTDALSGLSIAPRAEANASSFASSLNLGGSLVAPKPAPVLTLGAPALQSAPNQLAASQASRPEGLPPGFVPVPSFPQKDGNVPIYQATTPSNMTQRPLYAENSVPMNSMVLNTNGNYGSDATTPSFIAQAAMKVNPNIQFIVPTDAQFSSSSDPALSKQRTEISKQLGVPEDRLVLVRADMPNFPQDDFMAGQFGIVKPLERDNIGRGGQRTQFGPNQIASELGLPSVMAPAIARGGDTHVIQRPDGSTAAHFSGETLSYTANTHGFSSDTPAGKMRAIGVTMSEMNQAGVPMDQIMPLGRPLPQVADARSIGEIIERLPNEQSAQFIDRINTAAGRETGNGIYASGDTSGLTIYDRALAELKPDQRAALESSGFSAELEALKQEYATKRTDTYGAVLGQMSAAEKAQINPDALKQLESMRDLPFPAQSYAYHTDVMSFTPDGKNMFVREQDMADGKLREQLEFFGYNPVAMPSGRLVAPEEMNAPDDGSSLKRYANNDVQIGDEARLNYSNMITGLAPDGRQAILMPTEALDPNALTENDKVAMQRISAALPDALIVPMGGRSAMTGGAILSDGSIVGKDYGTHCMSNVLPYIIEPRAPAQP